MHRFNRKDALGLSMVLLPIAAIPLAIVALRPRPLRAETALELSKVVRSQREDKILSQMLRRFESVSLNMDGPDLENNPEVRWQQIRAELEEGGAEASEAGRIADAARRRLGEAWPCLVERCNLQGRPVWAVAGSKPHSVEFFGWNCIASKEDVRRLNVEKYCTDAKVVVIDAQTPFRAY